MRINTCSILDARQMRLVRDCQPLVGVKGILPHISQPYLLFPKIQLFK